MTRPVVLRTYLLATILGLAIVPADASDDGSPPLFIEQDGKRIPTVIIPPNEEQLRQARRAVLELVEIEDEQPPDRGSEAQVKELPALADEPSLADEPDWWARGYAVDTYAGYPVSVFRPDAARWWAYDPAVRPDYRRALEEAYRAGRYIAEKERARRFNQRDMKRRERRVLSNHMRALRTGLEHFKEGEFSRAVVAFSMACRLNQGDPAARIHLAQARMALGHYEEAGKALRRALQLQPKLVYVSLELDAYYSDYGEFDEQIDALGSWVRENRVGAHTYYLLGFMEFQRDDYEAAFEAFRRAARGLRDDDQLTTFLEITRPPRR